MIKLKKPIPLPKIDLSEKKQGIQLLLVSIGVALVLGIFAAIFSWATAWIYWILAIGVIVGILNIFHEEGILFLIAGLTLALMLSVLAGIAVFPVWAVTLFNAIIYVLTPATIIVGLKVLYALAR